MFCSFSGYLCSCTGPNRSVTFCKAHRETRGLIYCSFKLFFFILLLVTKHFLFPDAQIFEQQHLYCQQSGYTNCLSIMSVCLGRFINNTNAPMKSISARRQTGFFCGLPSARLQAVNMELGKGCEVLKSYSWLKGSIRGSTYVLL